MSMFKRLFNRMRGGVEEPEAQQAEHQPEPEAPEAPIIEEAESPSRPKRSAPAPIAPEAAEPEPVQLDTPAETAARARWYTRLRDGLSKSSRSLGTGITDIFTKRKLDAATLEELEDVLIAADLGADMADRVSQAVAQGRYDKEIDPREVRRILAREVAKVLEPVEVPFRFDSARKPFVILVVGVNGSGKTTTIGKLGAIAVREGFSVTLAACDTFRAAAIEQLEIWGRRIGATTVSRAQGADASGLAFDAFKSARESGSDILIVDTAGRLQNKASLMAELEKIVRVLRKQDASAPHAVLLVLDATTGQNAVNQTEVFQRIAGVTGLVMTKLDGTARGGILVALADRFKLPVHAIGVGEGIDDLQPFDAHAFARAIAGIEEEIAA
jgi:fused signal recognition particle receptor